MSQLVPYLNFGLEDSQVDSDFFYGYDSGDNAKMFIALEGLNSGVPTRTTPTLTPTTLRNIEQTFIELQSKPESHENEAGFVPPMVHSIGNNQYIPASEADIYSKSSNLWQTPLTHPPLLSSTPKSSPPLRNGYAASIASPSPPPTRRNMGGRKPVKDLNMSPEEEERRRVRRERNKLAAARCRKRRVDHTNLLIQETEGLEQKKHALQTELQELQTMKDDIEFMLENHRSTQCCRLQNNRPISPQDIKPYILPQYDGKSNHQDRVKTEMSEPITSVDNDVYLVPSPAKKIMLSSTVPISKPNRPSSLNVCGIPSFHHSKGVNVSEIAGITISTPSTGLPFNFDSLMQGGTGLTPVAVPITPSCGTQQRNIPTSSADNISSPDACGPPKLVSL